MEGIKIQNKKAVWCRESNQHTHSNTVSILMTKDVTISLHVHKSKSNNCVAHLRCQLLTTTQTLTEMPSSLRAGTYGMELCHVHKHKETTLFLLFILSCFCPQDLSCLL